MAIDRKWHFWREVRFRCAKCGQSVTRRVLIDPSVADWSVYTPKYCGSRKCAWANNPTLFDEGTVKSVRDYNAEG